MEGITRAQYPRLPNGFQRPVGAAGPDSGHDPERLIAAARALRARTLARLARRALQAAHAALLARPAPNRHAPAG